MRTAYTADPKLQRRCGVLDFDWPHVRVFGPVFQIRNLSHRRIGHETHSTAHIHATHKPQICHQDDKVTYRVDQMAGGRQRGHLQDRGYSKSGLLTDCCCRLNAPGAKSKYDVLMNHILTCTCGLEYAGRPGSALPGKALKRMAPRTRGHSRVPQHLEGLSSHAPPST